MTNHQKMLLDEMVNVLRNLDNQCDHDKHFAQELNNHLIETVWSVDFNHFVAAIRLTMNPKTIRDDEAI